MKKAMVYLVLICLFSTVVISTDVLRFSGLVSEGPPEPPGFDSGLIVGGSVNSCGNGLCQPAVGFDETNNICPTDWKCESDGICGSDWGCTAENDPDCEEPVIEPFLEVTLISSDTDGISDNTYGNGWQFEFDVSFYHPTAKYVEFKIDNFNNGEGHYIPIGVNVEMRYNIEEVYQVGNNFQELASTYVAELKDMSDDFGIQSTVIINVKLPTDTYPSENYVANYYVGLFE